MWYTSNDSSALTLYGAWQHRKFCRVSSQPSNSTSLRRERNLVSSRLRWWPQVQHRHLWYRRSLSHHRVRQSLWQHRRVQNLQRKRNGNQDWVCEWTNIVQHCLSTENKWLRSVSRNQLLFCDECPLPGGHACGFYTKYLKELAEHKKRHLETHCSRGFAKCAMRCGLSVASRWKSRHMEKEHGITKISMDDLEQHAEELLCRWDQGRAM